MTRQSFFLQYILLLCALLCHLQVFGQQQKIDELKLKLEKANPQEQIAIYNQMAFAALKTFGDDAIEYGEKAMNLAISAGAKASQAQALNLMAKGYAARDGQNRLQLRDRKIKDLPKAIRLFKESLDYARQTRNNNLALDNLENLIAIGKEQSREQEVINYYQQFITITKEERGFGSASQERELASGYEKQQTQFKSERSKLEREKEQLKMEISQLTSEKNRLSTDKTQLSSKTAKLEEAQKESQKVIANKEQAIGTLSKEKERIEKASKRKDRTIKVLVSEAEMDSIKLEQTETARQNAELIAERSKQIRNFLIALSGLVLLLAYLFYSRYRAKNKANAELEEKNTIIETEKKRSDELLLNILPAPIADELKKYGAAKARQHENVTVLFSDFLNFTKIAEQLSADELVKELDYCFKGFDYIISKYQIEKIKTIGDAYMCATGFDDKRSNPALDMTQAAMEMQEFLEDYRRERSLDNKPFFQARIGIHSGPVVAGVVGTKKFAYDIWGDTVNTAARLEATSESGKVNISENTYQHIRYYYQCTYRGMLAAKNKGDITMYFVDRPVI